MMKVIAKIRVFFVIAILVSAGVDLVDSEALAQPIAQLSLSGFAGLVGVALAKVAHVV